MKRLLALQPRNHPIRALHRLQQTKRGGGSGSKKTRIITSPLLLQRYQSQNQNKER